MNTCSIRENAVHKAYSRFGDLKDLNHKYGDTVEDTVVKLEYDLYYIKNLSPSLDFYIIFNTMKVILLSRGAQ